MTRSEFFIVFNVIMRLMFISQLMSHIIETKYYPLLFILLFAGMAGCSIR